MNVDRNSLRRLTRPLRLPVIAAPMFLVSSPELVVGCCTRGVIGAFPALNQRDTAGYERWLVTIRSELDRFRQAEGIEAAPYAVNLIVHRTNPRVRADLEVTVKHEVPLVITSLGALQDVVDAVHSYGGLVFHDVTNVRHAEKAAKAGVDGLICVSHGAGGHAGTLHPMALLAEVRRVFEGVIVLAGCISTGRDVAAALQMGADLAYMGTRFINTTESLALEPYKRMIVESASRDIVYTAAVSGVPGNFMRKSLEAAGITQDQWTKTAKIDLGSEPGQADSEARAWKTVWSAGQGVSAIRDVLPVSQLIHTLETEFREAVADQEARLGPYLDGRDR